MSGIISAIESGNRRRIGGDIFGTRFRKSSKGFAPHTVSPSRDFDRHHRTPKGRSAQLPKNSGNARRKPRLLQRDKGVRCAAVRIWKCADSLGVCGGADYVEHLVGLGKHWDVAASRSS